MKPTLTSLIAAGTLALAGNTHAEDLAAQLKETSSYGPKNAYVRTSWHSRYMGSFGFTLSEGPVIQSDLGFDAYSLPAEKAKNKQGPFLENIGYNLWTNFDPQKGKGLNEIDNSLMATIQTKHLTIQPDFYWFTFPGVDFPDAYTTGLTITTKNLPLDFKLNGAQAFGASSGNIAQASIGKSFPLDKRGIATLSLGTTLTYNNKYFVNDSGFSVISAGANVNVNLGKGYSLNAGVRSQKALKSMGGTFKDHAATFDISLKKSF